MKKYTAYALLCFCVLLLTSCKVPSQKSFLGTWEAVNIANRPLENDKPINITISQTKDNTYSLIFNKGFLSNEDELSTTDNTEKKLYLESEQTQTAYFFDKTNKDEMIFSYSTTSKDDKGNPIAGSSPPIKLKRVK